MAVQDYIPTSESKQTIKKEVKRKPTVEELTTVEVPGKPSPASMLESKRKRKYKPKSNDSGEIEEEIYKRDGKKIIVASAVGHLFNLTYKKGQKGWPIYEIEWIPSYNTKGASFTRKYYLTLKKLAQRANEIIIATDFDNEGELIGWNVLRFICKQKNAKRMKFSTLTSEELLSSFESPLSELAWPNAYAGETRHIVDWLYGINLS